MGDHGRADKPNALAQLCNRENDILQEAAKSRAWQDAYEERQENLRAAEAKVVKLYELEHDARSIQLERKRKETDTTHNLAHSGIIVSPSYYRSQYRRRAANNLLLVQQLRFEADLAKQYRDALHELAVQKGEVPRTAHEYGDLLVKALAVPKRPKSKHAESLEIIGIVVAAFAILIVSLATAFSLEGIRRPDFQFPAWIVLLALLFLDLIALLFLVPLAMRLNSICRILVREEWSRRQVLSILSRYISEDGLLPYHQLDSPVLSVSGIFWTTLAAPNCYWCCCSGPAWLLVAMALIHTLLLLGPLFLFPAEFHFPTLLGFAVLARGEGKAGS